MPKRDPHIDAHLEWIGFVRPTGLVVSAPALVRAGAFLPRDPEGQRWLRACVAERRFRPDGEPEPWLPDFRAFAGSVLGWSFSPKGYAGTGDSPIPPELETPLQEGGEVLRPDFAVREREPREDGPRWQLLVKVIEPGDDFDRVAGGAGRLEVSAHGRMERLLRQTGVPAGLLSNGRSLRLVSAPRGESSGWVDLHVADMVTAAGRPIAAALRLLLSETRLLALPREKRFAALLADSRRFQNKVSERLAEQVLHALYELLRGVQAADDAWDRELLREALADRPDDVYHALLTVILRLVFLLYAEERDLLPEDETFARHYSLAGLYERLREDAALHPDTMNQRYGAWAQLLVLFRLFHDGAEADGLHLPRRLGVLFDPDRFPFLEGRGAGGMRQGHERIEPPWVPDGTVYRALDKLLVLDGERISYRALDVEQIGSVYETMMGFRIETATGHSVAIKAQKKQGAPTTVDLEALLGEAGSKRAKWLRDRTDRAITERVRKPVAEAETVADLHAALQPVIDAAATPDLVPVGAMVLQPSEARRRSGSHYTPRELTEPIVRTTLEPILAQLRGPNGQPPTPEAILNLKVCDPAMGSGAFLVEACRQLGDALLDAWRAHDVAPAMSAGDDEVVVARRLIAQRCLYGVDRNPMAVDLAKVSLWLATLAKEHPLTFVDHALRHGDSLVGLSQRQIEAFHWEDGAEPLQQGIETIELRKCVARVAELRRLIREADDSVSDWEQHDRWDEAQFQVGKVRLFGDLVVAAFFGGRRPTERRAKRAEYVGAVLRGEVESYRASIRPRCPGDSPLTPFHWEIEFPEVFKEDSEGFDAVVGNPPFQGGRNVAASQGEAYSAWLRGIHQGSNGGADLVAHFFRRVFDLVRKHGAFGLIATNTIAQGDTRASGLRWICTHGGEIFSARKRVAWPGEAAVVVSVLNISKGSVNHPRQINGREVQRITAFLFHRGSHDDPVRLKANVHKSFQGSIVLGMGFTFDDMDNKGVASPLARMHRLISQNPRNRDVIFPYLGGQEVNASPTHTHRRYVIDFGERTESECWRQWPELMEIVEQRVRPERKKKDAKKYPRMVLEWWKHWNARPELRSAMAGLDRVLVVSRVGHHAAFTFVPAPMVYADSLVVFPSRAYAVFCVLQSRVHDTWVRFFGSSMKDDLRYTPSDCFETFPFPRGWDAHPLLEEAGREYYRYRAMLMKKRNDCEFISEYTTVEDREESKRWRYRWVDNTRNEILARLIELNEARSAEEVGRLASVGGALPLLVSEARVRDLSRGG